MASDLNGGAEGRFENFSGLEDGLGRVRHPSGSSKINPALRGIAIEPVDADSLRPFYERGMSAEEEKRIIEGYEEPIDEGPPISAGEERRAWEVERSWDQHLGTDNAGADLFH